MPCAGWGCGDGRWRSLATLASDRQRPTAIASPASGRQLQTFTYKIEDGDARILPLKVSNRYAQNLCISRDLESR